MTRRWQRRGGIWIRRKWCCFFVINRDFLYSTSSGSWIKKLLVFLRFFLYPASFWWFIFFQPGKYFLKRSFKWSDSLSGNCMSKLTIKSPLRLTSLGLGKPLPTMRLTVLGCTTSSCKLTTMRSPPNKGISARAPHRAWKIKRKKILVNHSLQLVFTE